MPVRKVDGGYQWGTTGKVYKTKASAEKQGKAIHASGYAKGGTTKSRVNEAVKKHVAQPKKTAKYRK